MSENNYKVGKATYVQNILRELKVFPTSPEFSFNPVVVPVVVINPFKPLSEISQLNITTNKIYDVFTVPQGEAWKIEKLSVIKSSGSSLSATFEKSIFVDNINVLPDANTFNPSSGVTIDLGGYVVRNYEKISLNCKLVSTAGLCDFKVVGEKVSM